MSRRGLAYGFLLAGAALALIASTQPWWRAVGEGVVVKITGTEATGGLSQALVIVVLAGTLLLLALRARGRRLVGALLFLVGLGMAGAGGLRQPNPEAVRGQVPEASLVDALSLSATVWPWLYAISGVLIAAGAAVTMITAGSWPSRSDRFRSRSSQAESDIPDDPAELWKAMDAGVDPTATESEANNRPERDARAAENKNDRHAADEKLG
ncbi:MAG TPA: Trp biosynthesis-associated membrane protein [Propionibacteriaceae bacterium]|nr:Trp biosynthesis-associated membrane protein [Propionibacteriaceae bacterium]